MYAKRFSNVQQFTFADGAERSLSGIRRSSATKGGINAQNEGQKISVPELASAFGANPLLERIRYWGVVHYRRFHCI